MCNLEQTLADSRSSLVKATIETQPPNVEELKYEFEQYKVLIVCSSDGRDLRMGTQLRKSLQSHTG